MQTDRLLKVGLGTWKQLCFLAQERGQLPLKNHIKIKGKEIRLASASKENEMKSGATYIKHPT